MIESRDNVVKTNNVHVLALTYDKHSHAVVYYEEWALLIAKPIHESMFDCSHVLRYLTNNCLD